MATRGKPSVFAALNQLRVSDAFDSDSAEEREQERKEKQKQKKKSRKKKTNNDSAQLKDLAFVSVSKPKKSKGKKKSTSASAGSPVEETAVATEVSEAKPQVEEPKRSLADMIKATPPPPQAPTVPNGVEKKVEKKTQPAPQQPKKAQSVPQPQQQKKKAASPPKQQHQPPPEQNAVPPSAPASQSSSETELGAVYSPTHITITRVDGQMKRTVAVTEVMDQLLRYTQQNGQLLMVQEQLGHANRSLQDQLQRSAEIINGLQNEVTMFRQMCLNLQAEVSLLRSSGGQAPAAPDAAGGNQHRPPPGMS